MIFKKDVEVKGAIEAYVYLEKYNYKNEKDLLKSHKFLMDKLLQSAGEYSKIETRG